MKKQRLPQRVPLCFSPDLGPTPPRPASLGAFSAFSKYRVLLPKKGNNRVKMVKLLKQGYQIIL
jgi:hypothetical protein